MALKFLNKKGWHTGSLRNIENVWKAEQKHEAEQKKLEELRKQIQEERERTEFRLLQEKAGLVPHQERLEFLYDSGLSVGNLGNSEGFKSLEAFPKSDAAADAPSSSASASASKQEASVPGALFEEKPQSANDAWRKLHSDPLLMIRQREQEALAKIKNNPVKMAMIKKSVQETEKEKSRRKKEKRKKHRSSKSKHKDHSDSEDDTKHRSNKSKHKNQSDSEDDMKHHSRKLKHKYQSDSEDDTKHRSSKSKHKYQSDSDDDTKYRSNKSKHIIQSDSEDDSKHRSSKSKHKNQSDSEDERRTRKTVDGDFDNRYHRAQLDSRYDSSEEERKRKKHYEDRKYRERSYSHHQGQINGKGYKEDADERHYNTSKSEGYASRGQSNIDAPRRGAGNIPEEHGSHYKRRNVAPKLSEEERAAKLREMQLAAELHEEQRWKRIKKAEETDAQEAAQNNNTGGKNFLDIAQKSVYGAAEGGSKSIAESVRRRTHYSQGRSAGEGNAFRR